MWNNRGGTQREAATGTRRWDWENTMRARQQSSGFWGARRTSGSDDRGEGPSNLGAIRQSTGYGGSSVR